MPERFEFSAIFLRDMTLAPHQGRYEHRKYRPRLSPLVREVGLDQSPHTAHHHFVASTEDDRRVISVRFNLNSKTSRTEIPGEKRVIHSFRAIRQLFARSRV